MAQWIWVWLFLKVEGDLEFFFTMIQPFSSFARRLRTSWHYYTRQLQYMGKIRFWCFVFYTPLSSLQSTGMFIPSNCVTAMQQKNPVNGSTSYLRILCSRKYLLGILCTAFTNQKWNIQKQFRRNKPAQLSHCPDEIFRSTPDYRFEQHSAAWAAPSSYLGGSRIIYTHPTAREGACAILFYSIIDLYKIAVKTTHTSMIVLMSRQSHKMCTFRYISGANTLRGHGTGWSGWPVH